MVTSFSSKSELALNLSPNGKYVTFMGYNAAADTADVSNANTPGDVDPTSADPGPYYRVVAQLGSDGKFQFTETNAFSGDNGRAAVIDEVNGKNYLYGRRQRRQRRQPEPSQVVTAPAARSDYGPRCYLRRSRPVPQPTPVGSFNVTQLGDAADKSGKGRQLPGSDALQQCPVLHEGQRQQRR